MKTVITIPTYNERKNVGNTIDRILDVVREIKNHTFEILVVDDNSPDGTQDVVKEYIKKYPKTITLITGNKQGLGIAYARGMKYAMKEMGADIVFEFDADGQHDPKYIPSFMKKFDEGYDYVIGSRYVPGGTIPQEWGLHRKIISYLGSFFARMVLFTPQVKDYTSGYKATRVKGFLDKANLDKLLSPRYAYKIDMLYQILKLGAKTFEVPIDFKNRLEDHSKSTIEDLFDSFIVVMKLRFGIR